MVKVCNGLGQVSSFPLESLLAHVSVTTKEVKDPLVFRSYRPISLLNVDLKRFTKILASWLQSLLPQLVHLDQVGFISNREARDNTIKVLNLVHFAYQKDSPCIFLSTDAEKAFDMVHWANMFAVLRHMGFGEQMLLWIYSVYSSPREEVKANGMFSELFPVSNGTRQGRARSHPSFFPSH